MGYPPREGFALCTDSAPAGRHGRRSLCRRVGRGAVRRRSWVRGRRPSRVRVPSRQPWSDGGPPRAGRRRHRPMRRLASSGKPLAAITGVERMDGEAELPSAGCGVRLPEAADGAAEHHGMVGLDQHRLGQHAEPVGLFVQIPLAEGDQRDEDASRAERMQGTGAVGAAEGSSATSTLPTALVKSVSNSSAPRLRRSSYLPELAVAITCAPRDLAICTARWPTPPAAVWTSTRWSACS